MTSIASSSALTDSPGVRTGPPIALIASQKPPAPSPSSTRPPDSRSSEAAALASIAGDGSEQGPDVVEPTLVGMVLGADQIDAELIRFDRQLQRPHGAHGVRKDEVAELDWPPVVHISLQGNFGQAYFVVRLPLRQRGDLHR